MVTYYGRVSTPADALILFEACRLGLLPRVQRRLSLNERQSIESGSVFVWDEQEAGMRRWTDGKSWSSSRVSGVFLSYREMIGNYGKGKLTSSCGRQGRKTSESEHISNEDEEMGGMEEDGYREKPDGLTKQSFSIKTITGKHLHLISYYNRIHRTSSELQRPTTDPQLRHIVPLNELYLGSTSHTSLAPDVGQVYKQPRCVTPPSGLSQACTQPSTLIVTPPTPSESPCPPNTLPEYTSSHKDHYCCDCRPPGFNELHCRTLYERLTPPLQDSPFSSSPSCLIQPNGQDASRDAALELSVGGSESQCSTSMSNLTSTTHFISALSGSENTSSRTRSKSLVETGEPKLNIFTLKKRNSWAEDQRAIMALDRKFMF